MKASPVLIVSIVCLAFAVLLYLTSVAGLIFEKASSPTDMGLVSTTVVFLLFGIFGLLLHKVRSAEAESQA